jgi:hypothetical protein
MGYAFAGGTTDGPGLFDFKQGTTSGNAFWDIVKGAVTPEPSPEQVACHAPKPILLNTVRFIYLILSFIWFSFSYYVPYQNADAPMSQLTM